MPIDPEVVWSGGGGFNHSGNGTFYDDLAVCPAGLITNNAVLVAIMCDQFGVFTTVNNFYRSVLAVLPDGDTIELPFSGAENWGSPNGGQYRFALHHSRFNEGFTLRSKVSVVTVIGNPDVKLGVVFAALLDLVTVPGKGLSIYNDGGHFGTELTINVGFATDHYPSLGVTMLGKANAGTLTLDPDGTPPGSNPGWNIIGQLSAQGATAGLGTFRPAAPGTPPWNGTWHSSTSGINTGRQLGFWDATLPPLVPLARGGSSVQFVG